MKGREDGDVTGETDRPEPEEKRTQAGDLGNSIQEVARCAEQIALLELIPL